MEDPGKNGRRRWAPDRWADEANDYFVAMAKSLMSLISWDFVDHRAGNGRVNGKSIKPGVSGSVRRGESTPAGTPRVDPETLKSLADRIDRTLRRGPRSDLFDISNDRQPERTAYELSVRDSFRDLFHHRTERRLSAVRYICQRKHYEAIPLLESIFAIEESEEVRKEIADAVDGLKSTRSDRQNNAKYAG